MIDLTVGVTPAALGRPAEPCTCGRPIPTSRVAYCSDRCRWDDAQHDLDYDDFTEDAA